MDNVVKALMLSFAGLVIACRKSPYLTLALALTWAVFPFFVANLFYPSDVLGLQDWMQGQPIRRLFTSQALTAGFFSAVVMMLVLALIQLNITTLIYHRVNKFARFWPAALVLVGVIGNGIWWLKTGYFDFTGAMLGCSPCFIAIAWQAVCEKLGGLFVFGRGRAY